MDMKKAHVNCIIRAALKEFIIKKNYKPTDITMLSYETNKILEVTH